MCVLFFFFPFFLLLLLCTRGIFSQSILRPAVAFFADVDAGAAHPTLPVAVDTADPSEAFVFVFDTDHDDDASSPSCAEDAPPTLALPDCTSSLSVRPRILTQIQAQKEHGIVPRTPRERATPGTNAKTMMCHEEESSVRFDDVWVKL